VPRSSCYDVRLGKSNDGLLLGFRHEELLFVTDVAALVTSKPSFHDAAWIVFIDQQFHDVGTR
jgi:hypothetical protein